MRVFLLSFPAVVCLVLTICSARNTPVLGNDQAVALSVELSTDSSFIDGDAILFDDVKINTHAGSYDPAFGVYVCPRGGLYRFMWTLYATQGRAYARLMLDDAQVKLGPLTQESGDSAPSGSSSMSAVVRCKEGSEVRVQVVGWPDESFPQTLQATYTSFLGFMLFDDESSSAEELSTAFMVEYSADTTVLAIGEPVKYDRVLLGDSYDAETGLYTCPMDGVYMFTQSSHCERDSVAKLLVESREVWGVWVFNNYAGNGVDTGTESVVFVLECRSGETVYVRNLFPTTYLAEESSFSGSVLPLSADNPVAFYVNVNDSISVTDGRRLVFEQVITNIGGNYFPRLGQFICPDDSLYLFSWNSHLQFDDREVELRLVMGGEVAKSGPRSAEARQGSTTSATGQAVVKCSQGTGVSVEAVLPTRPQDEMTMTRPAFTGFKLPGN